MSGRKRLIVCLDGTWNQQDSSTNVLHHFNLVLEGEDPESGFFQKKYYHPGVGTGVLDSVTGGGFGFGLEENIRDAYNWLIENYGDDNPDHPDEIYIFGFSRGAYTARSLVGFIGQCGLLRRGAPIPVSELWEAYCILGRERERRTSVWDQLFQKPEAPIRQISALTPDPWLHHQAEEGGRYPVDLNPTEKLLVRWSRRAPIHYLGIYDTVGAIGWDALAIPGLTSHMAFHNNLRPTTIIQHCRHALAIDENRSSFNHTPFLAFIGHGASDAAAGVGKATDPAVYWKQQRAIWRRKIEQRWFPGAHSNVGGGYQDNRLAEQPLQWMLEGGRKLGLKMEAVQFDAPPTATEPTSSRKEWNQKPRDSFLEFAPLIWTPVLRAKRNYRQIDPAPLAYAPPDSGAAAAGYSLESIHEDLDPSVLAYWEPSGQPIPPNLYEYLQRKGIQSNVRPPVHCWLKDRWLGYITVVLWSAFAAAGVASLCQLIGLPLSSNAYRFWAWLAAFLFPLVDWSESWANFKNSSTSLAPPRFRAFLDSIYWTRAFGVFLFLCGVVNALHYLGAMGWHQDSTGLWELSRFFFPVPLLAAAGAVIAQGFRSKMAWLSFVTGPLSTFAVGCLVYGVFWIPGRLFQASAGSVLPDPSTPAHLSVPGILLLFQLSLIYLWRALLWNAGPMRTANLGSIIKLQLCFTPARVAKCLEDWRQMLVCRWCEEDPVKGPAAIRLRDVAGEALWRDCLGFIPVYFFFLLYGLWFAAHYASQSPMFDYLNWPGPKLGLWWIVPLAAAAADYLENICHLRYLRLHAAGKQPSTGLTLFSSAMSTVKAAGIVIALPSALWAMVEGTLRISADLSEWRARAAVVLSSVFLLAILLFLAGLVWHRASRGKSRK